MSDSQPIRVEPGSRVDLRDLDPGDTGGIDKQGAAEERLERDLERLAELQEELYAENRRSLVVVLQAMDGGGKDSTIKHVMSGLNPQGCQVTSFKRPSEEELDHDFLWRIHRALPRRGNIGIFNRSHYEDVAVVRVHRLVPEKIWRERFDQINRFEKLLSDLGTVFVKFFLHISKAEQKKRFEERLKDPAKRWKFSPGDLEERKRWDQYMEAYGEAITRCSTPWAPWFVVPANKKWYRNLVVARTLVETLEGLDIQQPEPPAGLEGLVIE